MIAAAPILVDVIVETSCFEACNGSADFIITGGAGPYSYQGQTEELCAGDYQSTITDAEGCIVIADFTILDTDSILLELDTIGHAVSGSSSGFISVSTTGNGSPFTYEWYYEGTVISTEEDVTNLGVGEYFLSITDADDCSMTFGPYVVDELVNTHDLNIVEGLLIFPNPTDGLFEIELSSLSALSFRETVAAEPYSIPTPNLSVSL